MSRYTGPSWKLSRRLGVSLTETGKELSKRPYPPGPHGPNQRKKVSEYGLQLAEKQKLRHMFGLSERQFKNTFKKSAGMPGKHGENFMALLESRLDNVVYRLGLAHTRRQARQLVNHGHILVDGKRVDIPSYLVSKGQVITLREKSRNLVIVKEALEARHHIPDFVSLDRDSLKGEFLRLPERQEMSQEINESLIVEFYNR